MKDIQEKINGVNIKATSPYKKVIKPLMERRRRARINKCLAELKALVLDALQRKVSDHSKLEKADILEMTVQYLRYQQSQTSRIAKATETGYKECQSEVYRYLRTYDGVDEDLRMRMMTHLTNKSEVTSPDQVPTLIPNVKPLHVDIPPCSDDDGVSNDHVRYDSQRAMLLIVNNRQIDENGNLIESNNLNTSHVQHPDHSHLLSPKTVSHTPSNDYSHSIMEASMDYSHNIMEGSDNMWRPW